MKLDLTTRRRLKELAAEGLTCPAIARKLCVSTTSVRTWARILDIDLVKSIPLRDPRKLAEMIRLYEDGTYINNLAATFGCCRQTIVKILKEKGKYQSPPIPRGKSHVWSLAIAAEKAYLAGILTIQQQHDVRAALKVYRKNLAGLGDPPGPA